MTNEEAIIELNALNAICGQKDFYDSRFEEAFIMAIQALEESKEIRNKTIDEFAGLLTEILESWAEFDRMAFGIHSNEYSYLTEAKAYDRVVALIDEMAEDAKGDSNDN